MNGIPSAVSYNHQGKQQLYAFVRGEDGHLYVNFYDVSNSEWRWKDLGVPPGSNVVVSSGAEAVVANLYNRNGNARDMIYAFVTGNDGRLYARFWDGTSWRWEECNTPSGLRLGSKHSAVVWRDAGVRLDNISVFCWGIRNLPGSQEPELWEANHGLVDRRTWTYNWTWENRGTHANVRAMASNPGALKQPYPPALYAFVRGTDDQLYMHHQALRPRSNPSWHDQDIPQQTVTVAGGPDVISDWDSNTNSQKIYAFVRGDNGHLYVNYGDYGAVSNFNWHDCGAPANGVNVLDEPGVITYTWQGRNKIYAFVRGDNGHLYVWHGVGTNGQWAHQETPAGAQIASAPGVVTHVHDGRENIYVFVWGDDHKLHLHYWDDTILRWCWRRQGAQWGFNDPGGDVRCPEFPPVPVELSVTGIQCFEQDDPNFWPFDTEDDEPYVLVYSLSLPLVQAHLGTSGLDPSFPRPRVVKVGPWEDVDDDETIHQAPSNIIWDADSGDLDTPNDVLFVVVLMEHDNSNPEMVRGLVETTMVEKLLEHASSVGNRNDFARRMVDAMSFAVDVGTSPVGGGLGADSDDSIGPPKELRLTQRYLDRVFAGGVSTWSLPFKDDDAEYQVHFRLRPA